MPRKKLLDDVGPTFIIDQSGPMSDEVQEAVDGFFLAAEYGRSDVIKALTDHGRGHLSLAEVVDPVTGRSPLHVAVANGKKDALRVLLAAGFPPAHQSNAVEGKENGNRSAYALAHELKAHDLVLVFHQFLIQQVAANDVQSVHDLLQAGVTVDVIDAATGGTLLHWAASCHASDVLRFLLERDDVQQRKLWNERNLEGATPLHLACQANDVLCTTLLLSHGAHKHLTGHSGISAKKTALDLATTHEIKELFAQDLEHGHDQEMTNEAMQNGVDGISERDERSGPGAVNTWIEEEQTSKLRLQLEEKNLLVTQLKSTIDTLVQEAQEAHLLGEERAMLNYVRKLRQEKAIVERELEDAMEIINEQSRELKSLKAQLRQVALLDQTQTNCLPTSDDTASAVVSEPVDSTHSQKSREDLEPEHSMEGETKLLAAQPLKLDTWTSKRATSHQCLEKHGSDLWSTVWNEIWTGRVETKAREEDGEVIITV